MLLAKKLPGVRGENAWTGSAIFMSHECQIGAAVSMTDIGGTTARDREASRHGTMREIF
jgi:hypothetical protein